MVEGAWLSLVEKLGRLFGVVHQLLRPQQQQQQQHTVPRAAVGDITWRFDHNVPFVPGDRVRCMTIFNDT
jgi:hypothetical protein